MGSRSETLEQRFDCLCCGYRLRRAVSQNIKNYGLQGVLTPWDSITSDHVQWDNPHWSQEYSPLYEVCNFIVLFQYRKSY